MPSPKSPVIWLTAAILLLLPHTVTAFGAGNIASVAKIEGTNWRHGDIEDTLLSLFLARIAGGKKFDKLSVSRVYFGNWLRDYSQAIDVGTVKYVSAEAIRILLWVLGFMTFGYGTKEFEVTADRLGCYRPEDHIDNPKNYADNVDATQYDARLRGPVNERVELAIDPQTGMKNYIANENLNIMTSALHIRNLFGECIRLGRSYGRSKSKDELYEALRLLGTGLHCLEDYSAHSNFIELALIELGEHETFPHVGNRTRVHLEGARKSVYPIVTGTFGGVDFLHSVLGEFNDKATQSEIQELEGTIKKQSKGDTSLLKELLGKIPKSIFGGKNQANRADELQSNATTAQMNNARISPRHPEEFTRQMQEITRQIFPIIEWHDDVMKSITEAVEKIPILPELISTLEEQINIFVFSIIAPYILPLISQVQKELNTGSSEIIQSSKDNQLIVFNDENCSDPTHSMLSKDHFSNVLNEPAGKIAAEILKWVVPQIMQCWDDESVDINRTINRIIQGSFYHPALRNYGEDGATDGRRAMFSVVEQWWTSKDRHEQNELRQKLSREGVRNGKNHQGEPDTGHGCGHPLKMNKNMGNANLGSGANIAMNELNSIIAGKTPTNEGSAIGKFASKAAGGGVFGGLIGAIAGGLGDTLISGSKNHVPHQNPHNHTNDQNQQQFQTNSNKFGNTFPQDYSGGGANQRQDYDQQTNQYGGRNDERQDYNQYSGRNDERQDYNQQTNQYGGRNDERQEFSQTTSEFNSRSFSQNSRNQSSHREESREQPEFSHHGRSELRDHRKHHAKDHGRGDFDRYQS